MWWLCRHDGAVELFAIDLDASHLGATVLDVVSVVADRRISDVVATRPTLVTVTHTLNPSVGTFLGLAVPGSDLRRLCHAFMPAGAPLTLDMPTNRPALEPAMVGALDAHHLYAVCEPVGRPDLIAEAQRSGYTWRVGQISHDAIGGGTPTSRLGCRWVDPTAAARRYLPALAEVLLPCTQLLAIS